MHTNSCGLALDFSRDPYTCLGIIHNGPLPPVVTLRWYFTDLPFLEGTTILNNRRFDSEPWKVRPIGELDEFIKDWRQDGARPSPPGLIGGHLCHPEWLATGEPWPNDLPPTVYDADNIPACCPRDLPPIPPGPTCAAAGHIPPDVPTNIGWDVPQDLFFFRTPTTLPPGDYRVKVLEWSGDGELDLYAGFLDTCGALGPSTIVGGVGCTTVNVPILGLGIVLRAVAGSAVTTARVLIEAGACP